MMSTMPTPSGGHSTRLSHREMPDFISWLQCFSNYAAIMATCYPHKVWELWVHQTLMIGEHRKCSGRSWLHYNSAFRQPITNLEATDHQPRSPT